MNWQPIETYVETDRRHLRGLWVYNSHTQQPMYFDAHCGWINENGEFVNDNGEFGWDADSYTHWCRLPSEPDIGK